MDAPHHASRSAATGRPAHTAARALRTAALLVAGLVLYAGSAAGPAESRDRGICGRDDLSPVAQARCDSLAARDAVLAARDAFLGFARGACERDELDAVTQAHCDALADAPDDLPRVCFRDLLKTLSPRDRHALGDEHALGDKHPLDDNDLLDDESQRQCNLIRFLGEHNHYRVRLAPNGAVRSIHLIETESGREVVSSYPHGLAFAAEDERTREFRMEVDALDEFVEGRPTPGTARAATLSAAAGFATGLPIGWNGSAGPTPGQCFNYTINTPSNNVQQASFSSASTASSTAEQIHVSATVTTSFGLFKVKNTASFSDQWQASSFSSNQYYNFYSLYTLNSAVDSETPLNTQGRNAGSSFATLCGSQYMAAVPVGMVATISINYGSNSSSTQTEVSNQFKAHEGLTGVSVAVKASNIAIDSESYFTFSMTSYGGGTDATNALSSAFAATNSSGQAYYALCAQGDTAACNTFSGNMGKGASDALTSFNRKVDGLSGVANPDLSFFETFPSGVSGASLPRLVTVNVPTPVSDVLLPYATQLKEYVELVNQIGTLNNRANQINERVEADPAHNYLPLLDLTTTLRALGSKDDAALYAAARATLLDDLERCLGATEDNVTVVCDPIITNQSANAFEYFADGGPGDNFLAQQNTIALQYTAVSLTGSPADVMYISELPTLSTGGSTVPIAGEAALTVQFHYFPPGSGANANLVVLEPGQPISTENLSDEVTESAGSFTLWGVSREVSNANPMVQSAAGFSFPFRCTPNFAAPCDIQFSGSVGGTTLANALRRIDGLF